MDRRRLFCVGAAMMVAWAVGGPAGSRLLADGHPVEAERLEVDAAERLLAALEHPELQALIRETLDRNPGIAAAAARARAAAERSAQVKALPDPMLNLNAFVLTPETRTGPQRMSLGLVQALPWFGKLALREQAALLGAAAAEKDVESERLALLTEVRRLVHEIAFLDRQREITQDFRSHLSQHEEIARARYSTGVGQGQGVVKLQAAITRLEKQLLDIDVRRIGLVAKLNALRDRDSSASLPPLAVAAVERTTDDAESLLEEALVSRPEMASAQIRIAVAETLVALAEKGRRPDFSVGLTYTLVDPRDDPAGRLQPPPGNGDDVLAVQGGVTLPIRRQRIAAAVDEARESMRAAQESERALAATIRGAVADLARQLPLSWQQLRLSADILVVQAEEALESAQAGYVAGTLNALDLLDAEHVLFEAHTAVARATADYLIALAKLEGTVGVSLEAETLQEEENS